VAEDLLQSKAVALEAIGILLLGQLPDDAKVRQPGVVEKAAVIEMA
jgi:hypothetical protein